MFGILDNLYTKHKIYHMTYIVDINYWYTC